MAMFAGRLHQPLADDDPLTRVPVLAGRVEAFQHRGLRLLGLQNQRVVDVAAKEKEDPATGADAAHPDDLAGHVRQSEASEQHATLRCQAARVARDQVGEPVLQPMPLVAGQEVVQPLDHGRLRDELQPPVHEPRESPRGLQVRARGGLRDVPLPGPDPPPLIGSLRRGPQLPQSPHECTVMPEVGVPASSAAMASAAPRK
jgi:hypothetical protein